MYKIIADTHCHTVASTHAYSTVDENAAYAAEAGLKILALTDHGPTMPDAPHLWHFYNLTILPRKINGVVILKGAEANIIDYDGHLDIDEVCYKSLEWINVSFHRESCKPGSVEEHTRAYLAVAQNPYVDVIAHSGTEIFRYDYEAGVKAFKEYGKLVEINEGSQRVRTDSLKNCAEIAKLCKKYEVPVVVSSDAHYKTSLGAYTASLRMLEEIDFPENLILNADIARFCAYLKEKRGLELSF